MRVLITKSEPRRKASFRCIVNDNLSLAEHLRTCGIIYSDKKQPRLPIPAKCVVHGIVPSPKRQVTIRLLFPRRRLFLKAALEMINLYGRPATIEEVLALRAQHSDLLYSVVATGSRMGKISAIPHTYRWGAKTLFIEVLYPRVAFFRYHVFAYVANAA